MVTPKRLLFLSLAIASWHLGFSCHWSFSLGGACYPDDLWKNQLVHIIIYILLWGVIHFQQIYWIECMFTVCLHLTSVWLCMSVVHVFVVVVQWPIGTNLTSPFSYLLIFIPSAQVWKQYILQVTQISKILGKYVDWLWTKCLIFCFVPSVNH